mgnify:CR=1 FL=1
MPKRNMKTLHNPNLVFNDRTSVPILELNINKLPEEHRHDWLRFISQPTKEWLGKSKYKGKGTIWIIFSPSLNFNNELTQSIFLICQGFKEDFFGFLYQEVKSELGNLVTCLDQMTIHKEIDGWNAILHVEQGRVWRPVDAEEWEEK